MQEKQDFSDAFRNCVAGMQKIRNVPVEQNERFLDNYLQEDCVKSVTFLTCSLKYSSN